MKTTHMWVLLSAMYGLACYNPKWQVESDQVILDFGLEEWQQIPQLFFLYEN